MSSDEPLFMTIDPPKLEGDLLRLLCRTARENGRIEITNCGGGTCVLISKEELDCLERALEIFSASSDADALRRRIRQYAHGCDGVAVGV